jgi:hypothetical protein
VEAIALILFIVFFYVLHKKEIETKQARQIVADTINLHITYVPWPQDVTEEFREEHLPAIQSRFACLKQQIINNKDRSLEKKIDWKTSVRYREDKNRYHNFRKALKLYGFPLSHQPDEQ